MIHLVFWIPTIPQAKQSVRVGVINGHARAFPDKKKTEYQEDLKQAIRSQLPAGFTPWGDCPVAIRKLIYYYPIPKAFSKKKRDRILAGEASYRLSRPDIDNLYKPVADALQGVVVIDDSQLFIDGVMAKQYSATPGVMISLDIFETEDIPF